MAKTNFYLKTTPNSDGENLILMFFSYSGLRLRYSTGQSINPKYWNPDEQRARKNYDGQTTLNNYLSKLENAVSDIHRNALAEEINPSIEYLKVALDTFLNINQSKAEKKKTLLDCYDEFCLMRSATHALGTGRKYATLRKHLLQFSKDEKYDLRFENMTITFYEKWLMYGCRMQMDNETTYKLLGYYKTFLHWCLVKDYFHNIKFAKQWTVRSEGKCVQSLWQNEIDILYEYEITKSKIDSFYVKKNYKDKYSVKTFQAVQAMFLFGCFTGQRFSDIKKLSDATIKGKQIKFNQVKTTGQVHAVLNDYAKEIAEKYNYNFPGLGNQYVNKMLHQLFEMIGLDREIKSVKYIGAQRIDICEPLFTAVGFHWSRKSHATLSLEKGMRPETVMVQGGWKDRDSFRKYIAVSQSMLDLEMEKAWSKLKVELKKVG